MTLDAFISDFFNEFHLHPSLANRSCVTFCDVVTKNGPHRQLRAGDIYFSHGLGGFSHLQGKVCGAVHMMMEKKSREGELWHRAILLLSPLFSSPQVSTLSSWCHLCSGWMPPSVNILWRNRHTPLSLESRGRANQAALEFTHPHGYASFHHSVQLAKRLPHLPALLLSSRYGWRVSSGKMPHAEDQGTTFTTL